MTIPLPDMVDGSGFGLIAGLSNPPPKLNGTEPFVRSPRCSGGRGICTSGGKPELILSMFSRTCDGVRTGLPAPGLALVMFGSDGLAPIHCSNEAAPPLLLNPGSR